MKRLINYGRRRRRGGQKLLPPNPSQWENEHNALDLRDDLRIPFDVRLDHERVFSLLPGASVHPHGQIPAADIYLNHFREGRAAAWSGLAMTLPDGGEMVVYNDSHPITRVRATLMEEFFHLWLGHPRSVLRFYSDDERWRTYNSEIEQEAYGCGAAALLPYGTLRKLVEQEKDVREIAGLFGVSEDLVLFRAKVTKTYGKLRKRG